MQPSVHELRAKNTRLHGQTGGKGHYRISYLSEKNKKVCVEIMCIRTQRHFQNSLCATLWHATIRVPKCRRVATLRHAATLWHVTGPR